MRRLNIVATSEETMGEEPVRSDSAEKKDSSIVPLQQQQLKKRKADAFFSAGKYWGQFWRL